MTQFPGSDPAARCPVLECPVRTFREQVPGVLDRCQRRTAQGKVIDAQHPRDACLGKRKAEQQPQRGMPRDWQSQRSQQPGAGPAR